MGTVRIRVPYCTPPLGRITHGSRKPSPASGLGLGRAGGRARAGGYGTRTRTVDYTAGNVKADDEGRECRRNVDVSRIGLKSLLTVSLLSSINTDCRFISKKTMVATLASLVVCLTLGLASAEGAQGSIIGIANRLAWEQVDVPVALTVGDSTAMAASTYRSSAIWLDPGRVVLTPPNETPIPSEPADEYIPRLIRVPASWVLSSSVCACSNWTASVDLTTCCCP